MSSSSSSHNLWTWFLIYFGRSHLRPLICSPAPSKPTMAEIANFTPEMKQLYLSKYVIGLINYLFMFCIFISCELIKHGRRKISWGFKLTFPLLFFTGERRLEFWPQVDGETTAQNSILQRQSLSWKNSPPKLPRNVPYQKLISTRKALQIM